MITKEMAKKHKAMEVARRNELRRKIETDQAKVKKFLQKDK